MLRADIYDGEVLAATLAFDGLNYSFLYDGEFLDSKNSTAISLTLPKQKEPFISKHLHSFFSNLLA